MHLCFCIQSFAVILIFLHIIPFLEEMVSSNTSLSAPAIFSLIAASETNTCIVMFSLQLPELGSHSLIMTVTFTFVFNCLKVQCPSRTEAVSAIVFIFSILFW